MADAASPLTTEHLHIMRGDIAEFRAEMRAEFAKVTLEFDDMKRRFRVQEHHITALRRDEVATAEEITDLRHQIDAPIDALETARRSRSTLNPLRRVFCWGAPRAAHPSPAVRYPVARTQRTVCAMAACALWPVTGTASGTLVPQRSSAHLHLGAKAQPGARVTMLGGAPGMASMRSPRFPAWMPVPGSTLAASRPWV